MAEYHVVAQGEHVSGIAKAYGFTGYRKIWDHPNNADLKSKRKNPNVLFPGDRLFIPDRALGKYSRGTDSRHKFRAHQNPLKLRLILEDQYEQPIAGASCVLAVDTDLYRLTTDAQGQIEAIIAAAVRGGSLVTQDAKQTPYAGERILIAIGDLDPVEEISGQQARLNNLGYFCGDAGGKDGPDFRSAVEEFQCENGLAVDGICGPATQARLKQVHGC